MIVADEAVQGGPADCRNDEIGLPPPARIGSNGHRRYEERQLLLLQQILVLRELGVGLPEISRILAEQVDEVEALHGHRRRLVAERDRLDALAATARPMPPDAPADRTHCRWR